MNTPIRHYSHKINLRRATVAGVAILFLTLGLGAQSRIGSKVSKMRANLAAESAAAAYERNSLDTTLYDLQRITVATDSDIADLEVKHWKAGWKSVWLRSGSRKRQAVKVANSLRKNLKDAVPDMITDVQNSRGSVSTTFKLYNDLNLVVESLDSLIEATKTYGKKGEAGPLTNDYAALGRIRQDLSSYIQQAAASLEPRVRSSPVTASSSASSAQMPRKIVIDDNAPRKKVKKKPAASFDRDR